MSDKSAPKSQLRLEWVYGYRGHQCRNNLYYTGSKEVVFFVAGVGVVYNVRENKQRFFLGHDDDIVSLALHPDKLLVATGQIGKDPYICVWDSLSVQTTSILKDGHKQGISAMGFDKDGNKLVSVGLDNHATINVWDWRKGKILSTTRGHSDRVFDVQFHPYKADTIVSCGVKHIKFWKLCGNALTAKKGVFGKVGEIQTMLCLGFGPDDVTYSGTLSGDVYVWKNSQLSRVVQDAHKGSIYTMDQTSEGYVTGGKDGCTRLWDNDFKPISSIDLTTATDGYPGLCIRSVCWRGERVLVGTQDSEVFEFGVSDPKPRCLVAGHAEGEMWGLAVHPTKPVFATASDDCTLRLWNMSSQSLVSRTSLDQAARSAAFSHDGAAVAVGLADGSFMVLKTRDLGEVVHIKDRAEVIHELKFSPSGEFLAVGSNDNYVDIYSVAQRYKKVGQCSGNSSFITHLDWSEDSKYLTTNSGAAERLVFKAPSGKQVTSGEEIRSLRWATWTGVLGPEANGIWEKYTDTNDVNATDAFFGGEVIVTGDDFGLVKLFRFPSLKKGAKFRKYVGHSAHVTNVRFSADHTRVVSIGGADHAVFQWRYLPEGVSGAEEEDMPDQHAYVDSNSEDSDSDMSDVPEVDSDLEAEKQKTYERAVYREDVSVLKQKRKEELGPGQKRAAAPDERLALDFVHGYRGYDCRNNLFYLGSGDIVFHVAAVGVVYSRERHAQRHYTQHTDDILCLCIHPVKDVVATGQVGRDPPVHVWDVETLTTLSVLRGHHQRGVCAADFSPDGKKLATVGLDDNHSIVVWDWRKGEKLATTRGHKDKIFVIKWNPHEAMKLVTVGVKHIKFWSQAGGGFTSNRGTFGSVAKLDTMMCVAYGKAPDVCYTGGGNGSIYVWAGTALRQTVKAHDGPCFAMHALDKGFVTGGKDGIVSLWDDTFERSLKSYPVKRSSLMAGTRGVLVKDNPAIRAVVLGHGHILVGTKTGDILEISKEGAMNILVQGHGEGELWGLATHPSQQVAATVSDDRTLRLWDVSARHQMVNVRVLKKPGRCVCFSPDGKALAVGLKDGSFVVVNADTLEDIVAFQHRKQEISDIRFSPDPGKYLAVGSHDNFVDIYNVLSSKRVGVCKANSSYITHLDWDSKGKLLVTNSGAREQLFYEAPRGKRQVLRAAEVEKVDWATWTSVLGPTCEGIWPPCSDVTDVNAACLSHDKRLLATGDDFGFVKVFLYPVKGKHAKYKKYAGHSAHVTNVRWSVGDAALVSTGGGATATMVWANTGGGGGGGQSDDSDTDSEEEGGYDSDVAREKNIDYTTKTYVNPIRETTGKKPHEQEYDDEDSPAVSRKSKKTAKVPKLRAEGAVATGKKKRLAKVNDLELEMVLGYRGFDCRNNLHYLNDGADIVYHAAGAGIILNLSTGKAPSIDMVSQSFYLEHTDDIICLAVNQHPKYKGVIATGQIGAHPEIMVWDSGTKATLSILRGFHTRGVSSLDFSCSGKLLVSAGVDDGHSVAVWRWTDGTKVASCGGHRDKIFHAAWRPDSDSHFVTVGVKHVRFWSVAGGQLVGRKGVIGTGAVEGADGAAPKMQTMLSCAFGANNMTYTGAMSGDVYVWKENQLVRIVAKAHNGPIFSMYTTLRDGLIVTGAKERKSRGDGGPVKLWDQEMRRCKAFSLETGNNTDVVKSVCRTKGRILVGTKDSEFIEINEKTGDTRTITCGHGEGELWGLATHPAQPRFLTASEDGTVRQWDIANKKMLHKLTVGPARSADYSPGAGDSAAVGLKNGGFVILNTATFRVLGQRRDRGSMINTLRFSPDGAYLAVGSHEGCVDFYDLSKGASTLQRAGFCKGINGFVAMIDFSTDSRYVRVSTGAYVNQIFEVPSGKEVTDKTVLSGIMYAGWTSVLGPDVVGIWPRDAGKADVNTCHVTHAGNAVATGDDYGQVKLFTFPCRDKDAPHKTFVGHSAHVTCVRFTCDDRHLVSAGGDDCCIFVWKSK